MHGGDPNVFSGLATMRSAEIQARNHRLTALLALSALGLPVVLSTSVPDHMKQQIVLAICGLHVALSFLIKRNSLWITHFNQCIIRLENLDSHTLITDPRRMRISVLSFETPDDTKFHRTIGKYLVTLTCLFLTTAWFAILCQIALYVEPVK